MGKQMISTTLHDPFPKSLPRKLIMMFLRLYTIQDSFYTNLVIKWRKYLVGYFFVKKEGNAKYNSAIWSIPDLWHGEIGRKIKSVYSQFGII